MSETKRDDYLVSLLVEAHRYGNTLAIQQCSIEILPGEVHGLVGENGSGKSTIVKLLSGIIKPTSGSLMVSGEELVFANPSDAQRHGINTVFQETLISDGNTAVENVFLGVDGLFKRAKKDSVEREKAIEFAERLGYDASLFRRPLHTMSVADRQVLTLIRSLARPWKLLILDEATSALDIQTRDRLFDIIKEYKHEGRSVLFVSHRMDELEILIDRATVQRSGRLIGVVDKAEATPERLISMMSGDLHSSNYVHQHAQQTEGVVPETKVSLRDVVLVPGAAAFDLDVRSGEILGIAGLEGQGGSSLAETIAGVRLPASGQVALVAAPGGEDRSIRSQRHAFKHGIAYVPAKRQEEGLFAPLSVAQNFIISTIESISMLGFFRKKKLEAATWVYMDKLSVRPRDTAVPVSQLSGGNAQKVLIGRWLNAKPSVIVLNDPLRGVDVGTKRQFYRLITDLAAEGVSVVMLSTEIEELLLISDRIAVCRQSSVARVLEGEARTQQEILSAMFGVLEMAADQPEGDFA
ncbi:MAG: sugar ABC transporter ATP-binding protein [Microterricola sp.]